MRHELLIAVGAATILGLGVTGCSKGGDESSDTSSAKTATATASATQPATTSATAPATGGVAKVTVDGQSQNVSGPVVCSTTDGKFSIAIGEVITGVIVGLPDASGQACIWDSRGSASLTRIYANRTELTAVADCASVAANSVAVEANRAALDCMRRANRVPAAATSAFESWMAAAEGIISDGDGSED